jgi:arogenate/prephenate dehydratase
MSEKTVAFQGEAGAYSELAAFEYYGPDIETKPCPHFKDAFEAVGNMDTSHGMLPFENSLTGSIHRNFDLILAHDVHIVGEYLMRVSHCLLGLSGVNVDDIMVVHSHPQALQQCERSLAKLGVHTIAETDTAGSARYVIAKANSATAAIASRRAAEVYGLEILIENLEDNPENYTRFLALAKAPLAVKNPEEGDYKTSVVFSLKNQPGVLFKALSVFALRDIDLTKIESRPIAGKPWEYMFYVDFAGHQQATNCARALDHLGELVTFLKVLGSFPRHKIEPNSSESDEE